jgi:hypothetical protein
MGRLRLRVGQRHPELDSLLVARGVTTWAYVTAFNPGSKLLEAEENITRQQELEHIVTTLGFQSYSGVGIGEDRRWQPESSLLILGIRQCDAVRLAQRFGQVAIVCGELGQETQLVVCG